MGDMQNNPKLPPFGVLAASHSHTLDFKTSAHSHPVFSLFYVIAGKGFLDITADGSKKRIELLPDSAVLLAPGVTHRIIDKPRNPMTLFVIYFSHHHNSGNAKRLDITPLQQKLIYPGRYTAVEVRNHLRRILNEQSQRLVGYETAIISSLNEILVALLRAAEKNVIRGNSSQKRVEAILEHMKQNFAQPYSLPDVAAEINLSERHFTNLCRKITGMSFRKYLEELRLERAKELLETTSMPATAIAFEVGYEELSTFYRAFKSRFRLSPIAYKNMSANNSEGGKPAKTKK